MTVPNAAEVKEFSHYIVFKDTNNNYVMAYGYEDAPVILDMKYAFDSLSKDAELAIAIPDFHKVFDYITVDVMTHKKFMKYVTEQEEKMQKMEKKSSKKTKEQ